MYECMLMGVDLRFQILIGLSGVLTSTLFIQLTHLRNDLTVVNNQQDVFVKHKCPR